MNIIQIQNESLQRLQQHEPPVVHVIPTLLKKIADCDEELLKFALGPIGQRLYLLAKNIDFEHPEITSVFDGALTDEKNFAQECLELLMLGKFAQEQDLTRIIPFFSRIILNQFPKNIIKKIDSPQNNKMYVRLLKNSQERQEIRMSKRMQIIDLHLLFNKGEETWNSQPDNFSKFLRFNKVYQEDIAIAEKKANRYEEMGCSSLALEIKKSIDLFKESMEQSYYGFNRITLTNAAVILAKSLGYTYSSSSIKINKKSFYNFDPENNLLEYSPYVSKAAGFPVFAAKEDEYLEYEPRIYPLHELSDIIPENIKNMIALLEAFPDSGNKPIFDHFGVIVPGVNFPIKKKTSFLDKNGIIQNYATRDEATKALDVILIKNNYIYPIIIGEKDNKCFFISIFI